MNWRINTFWFAVCYWHPSGESIGRRVFNAINIMVLEKEDPAKSASNLIDLELGETGETHRRSCLRINTC